MKIQGDKLNALAAAAKVTPEALAEALPKTDRRKQADVAIKKVTNWMAGRDHPRCKPSEVAAMAGVLGCQAKDLVTFQSRYRFARSSSRKASLLTDLIRGRRVEEADALLKFNTKRAAVMVRKALTAAIADAQNADAAYDRLVVAESRVDAGFTIKRFQPKDRGRAHPILKRTSHIVVSVEEGTPKKTRRK